MALPVTNDYLFAALIDGGKVGSVALNHRHVGEVMLPSGKLVACDPLVFPETAPFELLLPKGSFPVTLSVAMFDNDQRVAFATTRFVETMPVAWDLMALEGQDASTLEANEFFGYPVDAGIGCFMDQKAARLVQQAIEANPDYYQTVTGEFDKRFVPTWSWANLNLGDGAQNLVAFTSGFGDGFFASYAGFDEEGEVAVVVTDFAVAPTDSL